MRKIVFCIAAFFIPAYLYSQINWSYDMTSAKNRAIAKGKLIVIDFQASWCPPCRLMERELWDTPEMLELSNNLIFLKIDIDYNKKITMDYKINSIPYVAIININEDVLWDERGYRGVNEFYLQIFKRIPRDVSQLNANLSPFLQKKETIQDQFELGKTYQVLGKNQSDTKLRASFITLSHICFKKVEKKQTSQS
jgi:thiol-disulfide isomerase/thioredoxin